ncbi:MAG: DegV family protein [Dehalococcoidia bacterium]|nr:DegV family protein [Dehalococcoidia bacterium]
MVKIICDSGCDLTPEMAGKYDISLVPLNVHFGNETFRDGIDITADVFYEKLVADKVHPTTSAPGPGVFAELYSRLAKQTDEIMVITISSKLSATYESAIQAKELVGNTCRIEVIDSLWVCGGMLIPALHAARSALQGMRLSELVKMVKDLLSRVNGYIIFDTLEYLRKGGRIGKAEALLGSLLKLNPVITLKNGLVSPVARTRSRASAIDTLVELMEKVGSIEEMIVEHATTPDELEVLANRLSHIFPVEKMLRARISPVIGVHTGPRVLIAGGIAGK